MKGGREGEKKREEGVREGGKEGGRGKRKGGKEGGRGTRERGRPTIFYAMSSIDYKSDQMLSVQWTQKHVSPPFTC